MTHKSSPIAYQEDQFELSNSSFLNLSTSNENQTVLNQEDHEYEQPKIFKEEYGVNIQNSTVQKVRRDYTESQ
jgi:hypothetical protein